MFFVPAAQEILDKISSSFFQETRALSPCFAQLKRKLCHTSPHFIGVSC